MFDVSEECIALVGHSLAQSDSRDLRTFQTRNMGDVINLNTYQSVSAFNKVRQT